MDLKYPHARLAVCNQLLLGRSCTEAIAAVAQELGLPIPVKKEKIRADSCPGFKTAYEIFEQHQPDNAQYLCERLKASMDRYQEEQKLSGKSPKASSSPSVCQLQNCTGTAPVVMDLMLQCLDEVYSLNSNSRNGFYSDVDGPN